MHIQTENFSGPLGLLLYLIRREEMDIFNINIHQITSQYLEYIKTMKKLDLEFAGEFIAMAASLIQIKSKMLLPNYNEDGEEIESEDPRKELVQKLLEYQKYQEAAHQIYQRPLVGRDLWLRGERATVELAGDGEILVEDNALYALIRSYRQAIRAMKKSVHRVSGEMQSISDKIWELKERLFVGVKTTFFQLLPESRNVSQVLVTFLSLLELTRMGFISIFQSQNFADIHIETKREIEGDVISKAESFEASNTEEVAEALLANFAVDVPDEVNEESLEPAEMAASDEDILREEQLMAEEDRIKLEQSGEVHES